MSILELTSELELERNNHLAVLIYIAPFSTSSALSALVYCSQSLGKVADLIKLGFDTPFASRVEIPPLSASAQNSSRLNGGATIRKIAYILSLKGCDDFMSGMIDVSELREQCDAIFAFA